MISIQVLLVLVAAYVGAIFIFKFFEKTDVGFKVSIVFVFFGVLMIFVIKQAMSLDDNMTSSEAFDKIVSNNYRIRLAQNSVILCMILSLIYGFYAEYRRSRKILFLTIAVGVVALSILFMYMIFAQF
jgi:hypothetical protein